MFMNNHAKAAPFDVSGLNYHDGVLCLDRVPIDDLARAYGTPLYAYSRSAILSRLACYHQPRVRVHYAVKANGHLAILKLLAQAGAGFDIVSIGELLRVLAAGGCATRVVYSGVGKTMDDIKTALHHGVGCINVEALDELDLIEQVAKDLGVIAPVAIRINPDIDANTHPYIATGLAQNKFGIAHDVALDAFLYANQLSHLRVIGLACHIGSQITMLDPFIAAAHKMAALIAKLRAHGIVLTHIDMGGGLGVDYTRINDKSSAKQAQALCAAYAKIFDLPIYVEPGRSIVAMAGALITRVALLKPTGAANFCVVDAAMNDLIRPSLYQAKMRVLTTKLDVDNVENSNAPLWQIVGQVCETGDFLAKDCAINARVGDVLAVAGAGAYGASMASRYNARRLCAEVMVDGARHALISARECYEAMWARECFFDEVCGYDD